MNVREVFCEECSRWKKREDLVESLNRDGELYCEACGSVLIRTDDYNPKKERKYTIRAKGIDQRFNWLMRDEQSGEYVFGSPKKPSCQLIFTEKELARDDRLYVLYNDAFEVEEVEDDE